MRTLAMPIILFAAVACGGPQNSDNFLKVGAAAPAFGATDQHGKAVSLADLHREGPVVLTFLRSFF